MLREQIGETAGQIWNVLSSKDEVTLAQLPKILKAKTDVTYQALGWLAREDKIVYRTSKDGKVFISLSEKERQNFSKLS